MKDYDSMEQNMGDLRVARQRIRGVMDRLDMETSAAAISTYNDLAVALTLLADPDEEEDE